MRLNPLPSPPLTTKKKYNRVIWDLENPTTSCLSNSSNINLHVHKLTIKGKGIFLLLVEMSAEDRIQNYQKASQKSRKHSVGKSLYYRVQCSHKKQIGRKGKNQAILIRISTLTNIVLQASFELISTNNLKGSATTKKIIQTRKNLTELEAIVLQQNSQVLAPSSNNIAEMFWFLNQLV